MFISFFYFIFSIPENCIPGITNGNWVPSGLVFRLITIGIAQSSPSWADVGFIGSFCPPETGKYSIILEGTYSSSCDHQSIYRFNNISYPNRNGGYQYLKNGYCYSYRYWASTCSYGTSGSIYYQKEGFSKILMNSSVSYGCDLSFCKNKVLCPEITSKKK